MYVFLFHIFLEHTILYAVVWYDRLFIAVRPFFNLPLWLDLSFFLFGLFVYIKFCPKGQKES